MKKQILLFLFSFTLLIHFQSFAQNKNKNNQPSLEQKLKTLEPWVDKVMKDWKVQGLAIAVVHKDKIVYAKGFGFRDVKKQLPVTAETVFAIGSCTKAFTAATVLQLADDGKLEMDKPVREYVPSFKMFDEYVSANMTPRDLLCHRSGLPRHDFVWYGSDFSRQEIFDRLRYLEPTKPFRTDWQYQNLMFMSAGYLVEQVGKQRWETFANERIIKPLEMTSTNFSVSETPKMSDYSLGYIKKEKDGKESVEEIPFRNIDAVAPAGSINSNVKDMGNWLVALINGGKFKGKEILKPSAIAQMQTPYMVILTPLLYEESYHNSYGLGWFITSYRGKVRVEHGGNIDGFTASTCFMPKDSIGIVILANMNGTAINGVIRNTLLDKLLNMSEIDWNKRSLDAVAKAKESAEKSKKETESNQKKDTKPSHNLKEYTGKFEHPAYGIMEIVFKNDSLFVQKNKLKSLLQHYHYDIFEATHEDFDNTKISFNTNLKGEIDEMGVEIEPALGKDIIFKRKNEYKPTKEELEKLVGEYELAGTAVKISLKGETLMMFVAGQPEYELLPTKANEFDLKNVKGFSVKFNKNDKGEITDLVSQQPNGNFKAKKK